MRLSLERFINFFSSATRIEAVFNHSVLASNSVSPIIRRGLRQLHSFAHRHVLHLDCAFTLHTQLCLVHVTVLPNRVSSLTCVSTVNN